MIFVANQRVYYGPIYGGYRLGKPEPRAMFLYLKVDVSWLRWQWRRTLRLAMSVFAPVIKPIITVDGKG